MHWSSRTEEPHHGGTPTSANIRQIWGTIGFVGRLLCIIACALCALPFLTAQPEGKRITFYTAQTTYSLPILDRNNNEYTGLLEALEPIGMVSAKVDGKKWKLKFRDIEGQFEDGKSKVKVHGKEVPLAAPFILANGRGMVPLRSLRELLAGFASAPVEVRETGRRVFIGANVIRVSARKIENGKVAFTFSAPVNPVIGTEPGKLRMVFTREPVHGDVQAFSFDDKTIPSAAYSEFNGAAELTVNATAPLLATFSDDRKTITVAPVPAVAAVPAAPPVIQPALTGPNVAPPAPPAAKPRGRVLVIIDAAHGGDDRGAALSDKIAEKDITLAIARRLRHELQLRGIDASMVRDADEAAANEERARVANASGAALYVAIHAASSGSGIHLFTAMIAAQARKPLAFVQDASAQAGYIDSSRAVGSTISTELLKRDMPVVSLPAVVAPLNHLATAALAIEVAPPARGSADDLGSPVYQQSVAVALAHAITAAQNRLPEVGR
ncbi:MAG TPA: N-acetylmuramoyl-L-alanine amidase [Terriglobales bacterium]|nr:N-acetylmuramoyl-L-alanine amidase [Terriglobales bacterium]